MQRDLLTAQIEVVDGRLILRIICDCGSVTDADITDAPTEFATTCDGCYTVRWFQLARPR